MTKRKPLQIRYLLLAAILLLAILFGSRGAFAFAEEIQYSDVLDDLKQAESFNPDHYPQNNAADKADFVRLIDVAESVNGELFVYCYQPVADERIKASSINISLTSELNIAPSNYPLELLNRNGVFYKYKVKGLTVSTLPVRYYVIPSILRYYVAEYDGTLSAGQSVSEVGIEVGEQFKFAVLNGKNVVFRKTIDTITVVSKFVGFIRCDGGVYLGGTFKGDIHFVAFDTDRRIDQLLEAKVSYCTQGYNSYYQVGQGERNTYSEVTQEEVELDYTQNVEYNGGGFFAATFKWDRIQSVDDFLALENDKNSKKTYFYNARKDTSPGVEFTDEARAEIKRQKWVLSFTETNYEFTQGGGELLTWINEHSTLVTDVMILRLKFITDGLEYNLGVVDNKQSGSTDPAGVGKPSIPDFPDIFGGNNDGSIPWWVWLIVAVVAVVLLIALLPFLPTILSVLFRALWWIIKGVAYVIALPFRGIAALIRAVKERREDKP